MPPGQRGADRGDVEFVPHEIRRRRAVPYGRFGAADAMYAPVVSRLHTYRVAVGDTAGAICGRDGVAGMEGMDRGRAARTMVLPHDEADWPEVLKE